MRFSLQIVLFAGLSFIATVMCNEALAVPAQGHQIMYAGASPNAVEIARDIQTKGGNAVDAAVAVALSMAVTHPYYASFGGGGFALVKMGKEVRAFDFREMAPAKANPDTFKETATAASRDGGLAVGVPGVPAGLWELHKKYGKLKWAKLFDGALRLADKGFNVSGEWASMTARNKERFNDAGRAVFFKNGKTALLPGEVLKQPKLASFLRAFQNMGPRAFYEGPTARDLTDAVNKVGGVFTLDDLKNYKVRWLEPITTDFNGYHVSMMPPPSSGGIVIAQALKLMEKLKITETKPLSVDEFHMLIEIMKLSFRGRQLLGDPDFAKNPGEQLMGEKYLNEMAALYKPDQAIDVTPLENISFEHENTTHFSVMTANGDAVSLTVTLNGDYGSGLVSPATGIALNNEMDDFTTKLGKPNMFGLIQGASNQVRAGARPLSSMSPTIVEKNGKTVLAVGAPGGPRITTAVLQVVYRMLTQKFDIDQAVQAPRVHHQFLPNVVKIDAFKFSPDVVALLEKRGHKIDTGSTGRVFAVYLGEDGLLNGAADARGEAAAGGL